MSSASSLALTSLVVAVSPAYPFTELSLLSTNVALRRSCCPISTVQSGFPGGDRSSASPHFHRVSRLSLALVQPSYRLHFVLGFLRTISTFHVFLRHHCRRTLAANGAV